MFSEESNGVLDSTDDGVLGGSQGIGVDLGGLGVRSQRREQKLLPPSCRVATLHLADAVGDCPVELALVGPSDSPVLGHLLHVGRVEDVAQRLPFGKSLGVRFR